METILQRLNLNSFNCDYCDVRIEEMIESLVSYRNGELHNAKKLTKTGAFIRIKANGRWFFASTTNIDCLEERIIDLLKSAKITEIRKSAEKKMISWQKRATIHTNAMVLESLTRYQEMLAPVNATLMADSLIFSHSCSITAIAHKKWYLNSKGTAFYYDRDLAGMSAAYSFKEGENQFNSNYQQPGNVLADFDSFNADIQADIVKAKPFLNAPTIEAGTYPVVLSEMTAGIFAHESFGHKSEADFMLGDETMRQEWELGKEVGSSILSIVDEGDIEKTSGFTPFDDEGNPKLKTYLIKNGKLTGRLHSISTAEALEEESTGNARAMDFTFEPIVRMTNTYIEAGDLTFDELLAPIKDGFYIEKPSHGSGMSTFTIAVNRGYRIRDGKLAEAVKLNVISGSVFETLYNIDGLTNEIKLLSFVGGGCGKMEQWPLPVGFGGPKVRISKMMVS